MRPATRLALTCALLAVVVLGAATATPWQLNPPRLTVPELSMPAQTVPSATSSESPPPPDAEPPPADISLLVLIAGILIALLFAAVLTIAARHLLAVRREHTRARPDTLAGGTTADGLGDDVDLPEIQDAVTRALAHLDGHARPRDAAWVALEEAAERAGTRKDPAQTTTEFAGTVLAATPAPPAAVTRLRTLYQRARFTDRPIDRPAVTQAREALADIARSLDVHEVDAADVGDSDVEARQDGRP